jgi:hypothetical protein
VPKPTELKKLDTIELTEHHDMPEAKPKNAAAIPWARILSRVYDIDALECDRCGERMKPVAAILDLRVAANVLRHLGLPHEPPTFSAARAPP